jgi:hypothetical protein
LYSGTAFETACSTSSIARRTTEGNRVSASRSRRFALLCRLGAQSDGGPIDGGAFDVIATPVVPASMSECWKP